MAALAQAIERHKAAGARRFLARVRASLRRLPLNPEVSARFVASLVRFRT